MVNNKIKLQIKFASLANEAKDIRRRERKLLKKARQAHEKEILRTEENARDTFADIRSHRLFVVRPEARATHLAFAYLRGKPYREIEQNTWYDRRSEDESTRSHPSLNRVVELVLRYGPRAKKDDVVAAVTAWFSEGEPIVVKAEPKPKRTFVKVTDAEGNVYWTPDLAS